MVAQLADKSPADLMADYLGSHGVFTGWGMAVGMLPATPDKVVALLDMSGPAGLPTVLIDFPGVQIMVRGGSGAVSYNDCWKKIKQIRDLCLGMPNAPAEFPELWGCVERGQPIPLGPDDKNRPVWSYNLMLTVGPSTTPDSHRISA